MLATVSIVGVLALVVGLLFAWSATRPSAPGAGTATPPSSSAENSETPSVVIATPDAWALARAAERKATEHCLPGEVAVRFTAVSFNIKSGHGRRGASLARIAQQIEALEADVVLLQEVDRHRAATGYVDQPEALATQLGMVSAFGANVRNGSQEYGVAILSRYPIVSAQNSPLPNARGRQPRGLLHAVLDVDGVEVSVFNTHLDFHADNLKGVQMGRAAQIIAEDTRPGLVGGDLNAFPGSAAVRAALSVTHDPFATVGHGSAATSPAHAPRSRIDYLLHRGPGLTPLATVVPRVLLSDHLPVLADYELRGMRTCP